MQTLFAGAWQSPIGSEGLPSMTVTSNVEAQGSTGPLRGWLKGHFPINTLQGEGACAPHVLRKGACFIQAAGASGKDTALPGRGHVLGWLGGGATR